MALKSGRVGIHPSQVDPITGMLLSGPSGTSDYEQLSNLPKINSVTLKGNKSLSDLGVPTSFEDMSDSDISTPEAGQILQYNGSGWENVYASISPVTPATLASLSDVDIDDPTSGQTLEYDGSKWKNVNASIAPTTLAALQDVTITSPADGDYLVYDSTSEKWINSGEAPSPTYVDVTATIYGAVEDTISFTDAAGISHSVTFGTNEYSAQETFKIDPSGSSITFTSAVAKDPSNLSNSYTKTISITSGTTSIYVMPSDVLYWWGYESAYLEDCISANGWSSPKTLNNPTHNKNNIYLSTGASSSAFVGTTESILSGAELNLITECSSSVRIYSAPSKVIDESYVYQYSNTALSSWSHTLQSDYTGMAFGMDGGTRTVTLYALWYE